MWACKNRFFFFFFFLFLFFSGFQLPIDPVPVGLGYDATGKVARECGRSGEAGATEAVTKVWLGPT